MLDPQLLLVAADFDVVLRREAVEKAILQRRKRRNQLVVMLVFSFGRRRREMVLLPNPNLAVLMGSEDFVPGEGDGLGPARARPECLDEGERPQIEDDDLFDGCGVQEVPVRREAADLRCRSLDGGDGEMGD